jgi:hypothetical protein
MSRAGLAQLLKPSQIGNLRDPLNSELLRHLERRRRDVGERRRRAARDVQPYRGVGDAAANLTMIWPLWEMGFGDVLANTVLPLGESAAPKLWPHLVLISLASSITDRLLLSAGELLRLGRMPTHLAVSGMRHAPLVQQLRPTASAICASERASALLPRCTSRCWGAVHICAPGVLLSRPAMHHGMRMSVVQMQIATSASLLGLLLAHDRAPISHLNLQPQPPHRMFRLQQLLIAITRCSTQLRLLDTHVQSL